MKKTRFFFMVCMLLMALSMAFGKAASGIPPLSSTADSGKVDQFKNPIWSNGGADPWIWQESGVYYFTYTQGAKVVLYKTGDIAHLSDVVTSAPGYATVYAPPSTMKNIWAPELHRINNKWYMYFAADDGQNKNHRMYVIENPATDPTTGTWTLKGKVGDTIDNWAIDGTILDYNNQLYMIWSGWESAQSSTQNLYIAKLSDPWTVDGDRVKISAPLYDWEKHGLALNEGPAVLKNDSGHVFVTYSASLYATDNYCLGMLNLKTGGDPMNAADWIKSTEPVFSRNDTGQVYGPGHNGFFKSPDGKEDWIVYHARSKPDGGSDNPRSVRIQKFSWNTDGSPDFGQAVSVNQALNPPSSVINARPGAFVTSWRSDFPGGSTNQIQFTATGNNFNIHWEDMSDAGNTGDITGINGANTVTFPHAGTYVVSITPGSGTFTGFAIGSGTPQKLLSVEQWGSIHWSSFAGAYNGATNMALNAIDTPVLEDVTDMSSAFRSCSSLTVNGRMNDWHTDNVTNMSYMFNGASAFNQSIDDWNTSSVTNMSNMFNGARAFNQPLGDWNTGKVTNIGHVLQSAVSFNQDISHWDLSSVTNMAFMFYDASSFNQDVHSWNTAKVENMVSMFQKASSFNQDIGDWDLQSVKMAVNNDGSLVNMLSSSGMDCSSYSQTLEGWASGGNTPADLTLGVSGLSYDSAYAQAAHSVLADTRSWNITGDLLGHCSVAPVTLPVRLVSFTGTLQHSIATLQWQTGSEAGSHHFDIESARTSKGDRGMSSFSNVGNIGVRGSDSHYTFSVPQPERTVYYRLKITDGDGSYTYSDNIVMLTQNTDNNLSVYPNPATDHINIAVRQAGHIRIYNILGKLLKTAVLHAGLNAVNISSFSAGVYFCDVDGTKVRFIKK